MRSYLKTTIKPLIRSDVRSAIVDVTKYTNIFDTAGTKIADSATTDDVWIPSYREIYGGTKNETKGEHYSGVFNSNEARQKMKVNSTIQVYWWLRSAYSAKNFMYVVTDGQVSNNTSSGLSFVALGFCL